MGEEITRRPPRAQRGPPFPLNDCKAITHIFLVWAESHQTQEQPPVRIVPTLKYVLLVVMAEGTKLRAVPASIMILECTFGSALQAKSIPVLELVMVLFWIAGTDAKKIIPLALPKILLEVMETPSDSATIPANKPFATVLADMEPVDKGTVEIPSKPGLTTRLSVTVTAVPPPISIPVELFGFEVVTSVPLSQR